MIAKKYGKNNNGNLGKKILSILLVLAMVLSCAACSSSETTKKKKKTKKSKTSKTEYTSEPDETSDEPSESTDEPTKTSEDPTETTRDPNLPEGQKVYLPAEIGFGTGTQNEMTAKLLELDRVVAAEYRGKPISNDRYFVVFEMPLDWKNPDAGTFFLRTGFTYVSDDTATNFCCNGYMLNDIYFDYDFRSEIGERYDLNQIDCEYRFFGASVPEGLDNTSTDLWEYLTAANAAADFHHIIEQYKTFLTGKWAFTGGSKGGQLTHFQSYFYPDDCDLYFSFVAPGGVSPEAPDFFDNIYTTIGNEAYGKEQAAAYRDLVLQFQVEAMKLKPQLAERYYQDGLDMGCVFTDYTTPEILYDMAVLEFATITWQYSQDFYSIEQALAMDKSSQEFVDEVYDQIFIANDPSTWSTTTPFYPYYIQAATENGEHEYDFSFIREALKKEGLEDLLTVTEDMESGLLYRMVFTPAQLATFTFDSSLYDAMVEWSHTTEKTVIMFYGASDVWYAMRLPDVTDNPNVHIYVDQKASHIGSFTGLPSSERAEIDGLVSRTLDL
ncbi:MAG: hypothetical protein J5636_06200 [Clostridiales bacterium]|nr:hypothetical protein [Clostridiales bacterium]